MTGLVGASAIAEVAKLGLGGIASKAAASARADWAAIPPKVKLLMLELAIAVALVFVHQHYADNALKAADAAGYARAKAEDAAAAASAHSGAIATRDSAEATGLKITTTVKGQHDAQVGSNASDARSLQLRGPGKAAAAGCGPVDHSTLPAAAGGHFDAASGADAAAAQVRPGGGLAGVPVAPRGLVLDPSPQQSADAVVPWSWEVDRGQEFDDLLAEVVAWRSWYAQQSAAWEKLRNADPAPRALRKADDAIAKAVGAKP